MDGAVVVAPPAGFAVAAEEDADQPATAVPVPQFVPSYEPNETPPEKSGTLLARWRRRGCCNGNHLGEELGEGQSVILCDQDHPPALNHAQFAVSARLGSADSVCMLPCILRRESLLAHHAASPGRLDLKHLTWSIAGTGVRNGWQFHATRFLAQSRRLHFFHNQAELAHRCNNTRPLCVFEPVGRDRMALKIVFYTTALDAPPPDKCRRSLQCSRQQHGLQGG